MAVQIRRLSLVSVWVTVGTGPQCCNGETFGPPIKGYILYCKRVGRVVGLFVGYTVGQLYRSQALVLLLVVVILL